MLRTWIGLTCLTVSAAWAQQAIVCPANAMIRETASAPGWETGSTSRIAPFERISIFDGPPAELADLAPSAVQRFGTHIAQSWNLADYTRSKLYLVCRYHGTDVTFTRVLPPGVQSCSFSFTLVDGEFTGTSSMSCR